MGFWDWLMSLIEPPQQEWRRPSKPRPRRPEPDFNWVGEPEVTEVVPGVTLTMGMAKEQRDAPKLEKDFLPDIPSGMRIRFGGNEVKGIQHRLEAARAFALGAEQSLRLEPEPTNPHDRNAIKVLGIFVYQGQKTYQAQLGYVDAFTAKVIAEEGIVAVIQPRLKRIWWGGFKRDFIVINFDVLAPKPPPKGRKKKT